MRCFRKFWLVWCSYMVTKIKTRKFGGLFPLTPSFSDLVLWCQNVVRLQMCKIGLKMIISRFEQPFRIKDRLQGLQTFINPFHNFIPYFGHSPWGLRGLVSKSEASNFPGYNFGYTVFRSKIKEVFLFKGGAKIKNKSSNSRRSICYWVVRIFFSNEWILCLKTFSFLL